MRRKLSSARLGLLTFYVLGQQHLFIWWNDPTTTGTTVVFQIHVQERMQKFDYENCNVIRTLRLKQIGKSVYTHARMQIHTHIPSAQIYILYQRGVCK